MAKKRSPRTIEEQARAWGYTAAKGRAILDSITPRIDVGIGPTQPDRDVLAEADRRLCRLEAQLGELGRLVREIQCRSDAQQR